MTITRDGQAPYAPTESVMAVINGYRSKHPHTPFTIDNIQPLGVSPSIATRTLQALRLLDLVDDEGEPTATLDALREASSAEFPSRLAEVLRAAYAEVFAYKDPAHDTPEGMAEVFRFYKPPSMQPRMVRLFYGLCAQAGIIETPPAIESTGKTSSRRSPGSKAKMQAKRTKRQDAPPLTPPPAPLAKVSTQADMDTLKARYVDLLLDKLQSADGGFDAELADRIERLMDFRHDGGDTS